MQRTTLSLRRLRILFLVALAACDRVTGPQAIQQAMQLEHDAASGKASVSSYATMFAPLQKSGDAAPLRVIVDGVEKEYWAFVFDRDYTPSRGNDPKGPERRRADMILWRLDDPEDYFLMKVGVARAALRPAATGEFWWGPAPWITHGATWLSTSGDAEIGHLQDSVATCEGLIDVATDQWVRKDFKDLSNFPPDNAFGPDPRITCARARFTVSVNAVLRERVWVEGKTNLGPATPIAFRSTERRVEIPPQTVPGTRLVVECNGTEQSTRVGCGLPTRPDAPSYNVGRSAAGSPPP